MTLGGSAITAFPFGMIAATIISLSFFAAWPSIWTVSLVLFIVYLAPPIAFRIHNVFAPLREGVTRLDGPGYSPWWGAHQIQVFYDTLPFLEAMLRVIPGWYSMWLRLWGSRVGFGVHWTPRVEIVDRSMMDIGNRVVFGHKVECYAHVIRMKSTPGGEQMKLLVRKIYIGRNCFIGAGSRLGPGARIPQNERVPALTDVGVNETFNGATLQTTAEEADMAHE